MPLPPDTMSATHVRFVPFEMHDRRDKVLVGRDGGSDWIVLDPTCAEVMAELDRGVAVEEIGVAAAEDVLALVRELDSIGFVAAVGEQPAASSRVLAERRHDRFPLLWRLFELASVAALGYVAWVFASGAVPAPGPSDLVLPQVRLGLALAIFLATALATSVVHELAHVVVGRWYGLEPRVALGGSGIFSVARTNLTGVWALPRSLQWRPLAAGLMADLGIVAISLAVAGDVGRMVATTVLCRMLWQAQWYLRTDAYYLFAVLAGSLELRATAGLWLRRLLGSRRAAAELRDTARSEVAAARAYWLSLPVGLLATVALGWWLLVPLGRIVVEGI